MSEAAAMAVRVRVSLTLRQLASVMKNERNKRERGLRDFEAFALSVCLCVCVYIYFFI